MGLCKCPKKKVTNLFCFEHRVNVCEHCLVDNHPKCIVQSYLHWLQDSDYNPICVICNENLDSEERGECIRLLCYDVFHLACLAHYGTQMPSNTAPAGFECPSCSRPIIPAPNLAGPVAERLKERLRDVSWARPGLGLHPVGPVPSLGDVSISEEPEKVPGSSFYTPSHMTVPSVEPTPPRTSYKVEMNGGEVETSPSSSYRAVNIATRNLLDVFPTHPAVSERAERSNFDSDDFKYRRRPILNSLAQWLRNFSGPQRRAPSAYRRFIILAILIVFLILTLVALMLRAGRNSADSDPMLDPRFNPQIRVDNKL